MMQNRDLKQHPLRLGILGCGSFVERRILSQLHDLDTIRIVAIQKRNQKEAERIAHKYNIPYAVTKREELLKLPEVEAVFIATPNNHHEADALACAAALKPTLCEKPLAPTASSVERMLEAFKKRSVPFFVGHSLRFKQALQIAKKLLETGELGTLLSIRATYSTRVASDNWRNLKKEGGGVLQDIGIHLIDLIHFISQDRMTHIYATSPDYIHEAPEADLSVAALCRLSKGAVASFECSFNEPFYNGFEVVGTKSRLISIHSLRQTSDPVESLCHLREDGSKLYFPLQASNIYVDELRHFAQVLFQNTPTLIPAEIGLLNQRVVEAAYQSLEKHKEITI